MLAQPAACLVEMGGEVRRRMRRPAWKHMMDLHRGGLTTRHTPLQAMTASKEGGYGGMVGGWEDGNTGERVVLYVCHSSQAHGSPVQRRVHQSNFPRRLHLSLLT